MGRFRPIENFFLTLTSALMPIPSLAWVPVFILWFGLGSTVTILIVFYAALFPMLLNTWSGVRSVNPLWLRAASAMGADEHALFWKVMIPATSPFIITGMRQAFLRVRGSRWWAPRCSAASDWGLGWVIFDAKEFLNADVMLAALVVIGAIGFAFERLVFGSIERATVLRWGMVRAARQLTGAADVPAAPTCGRRATNTSGTASAGTTIRTRLTQRAGIRLASSADGFPAAWSNAHRAAGDAPCDGRNYAWCG